MTDNVTVEQCDRDARNRLMKLIDCMGGDEDCWQIDRAFARHRIAERERCVKACDDAAENAREFTRGTGVVANIERGRVRQAEELAQAIREPKP